MNFKNILLNTSNIILGKIIQLFGILLIFLGVLFLLSLISYSPEDPNFIFSDDKKINNLLGFKGSVISDFFFQAVGLISYLIPLSLLITGINILLNKRIIILFENIFFIVLYSLVGSIYLSIFYQNSFFLTVNGNGGFIGSFLSNSFLKKLVMMNEIIFYYCLIFVIIIFFLLSINFKLNYFKIIINYFFKTKAKKDITIEEKENTDKNITKDNIDIQENFTFDNFSKNINEKKIL